MVLLMVMTGLQSVIAYTAVTEASRTRAEQHRADSLQASRDSLYRQARRADWVSGIYARRAEFMEGQLNQCRAYQW